MVEMTRSCGTCSLCCFTMGVEELKKPPLKWCEHCKIGADHACTIYQDRPTSCSNFTCLWLTHPETPEEMKPSRTGVVLWITADGKHAVALTRKHQAEAWRKPVVLNVLRKLARDPNLLVVAFSGSRAWMIGTHYDEELPGDAVQFEGYGVNKLTISAEVKARVRRKP